MRMKLTKLNRFLSMLSKNCYILFQKQKLLQYQPHHFKYAHLKTNQVFETIAEVTPE